jgi:exosome complex component MTR3
MAERPTPNTDDIQPIAMNTDRRRNNAPSGGTSAPVFARTIKEPVYLQGLRPSRSRKPNELRKICE